MTQPKYISESDIVPSSWYDGKYGKTVAQWGVREYELGVETGRKQIIDEIINYFYEKAGKAYSERNDSKASILRDFAIELEKRFTTKFTCICIINGVKMEVPVILSYEYIAEKAGLNPKLLPSITYGGGKGFTNGILDPGKTIEVTDGTRIDASYTGNA